MERKDFEMFTPMGNKMVATRLKRICDYIGSGKKITPDVISKKIDALVNDVSKRHGEVNDTEPRWHIKNEIYKCLKNNFFDADRIISEI